MNKVQLLRNLQEIRLFFEGCKINAWENSKAAERFERYIQTTTELIEETRKSLEEEDDGQ